MKYCLVFIAFFLSIYFAQSSFSHPNERSEVGTYKNKFIWTGTGQAFVPNYILWGVSERNPYRTFYQRSLDTKFPWCS